MTLTETELNEFKRLYKEEFGVDLTNAQAYDQGSRLVRLLKVVLKGHPDYQETQ
jgi:hypothetical protein